MEQPTYKLPKWMNFSVAAIGIVALGSYFMVQARMLDRDVWGSIATPVLFVTFGAVVIYNKVKTGRYFPGAKNKTPRI